MVTTKIYIKEHLAEYLNAKFGGDDGIIHIPPHLDLYYTLFDCLQKRPKMCLLDEGNIEIALPNRSVGKDPRCYNYLSVRSKRIIEVKVEMMFWADIHDKIDYNKHQDGIDYKESVYSIMNEFNLTAISEDALLKNYYRWRIKVRKRDKKRAYKRG